MSSFPWATARLFDAAPSEALTPYNWQTKGCGFGGKHQAGSDAHVRRSQNNLVNGREEAYVRHQDRGNRQFDDPGIYWDGSSTKCRAV